MNINTLLNFLAFLETFDDTDTLLNYSICDYDQASILVLRMLLLKLRGYECDLVMMNTRILDCNKMLVVDWSKQSFEEIMEDLRTKCH